MKKVLIIVLSTLIFVVGLGVMFYPTISNWLHEQSTSYAITDYVDHAGNKSEDEYLAEFETARLYNATLTGNITPLLGAESQPDATRKDQDYWEIFDEFNGIMGVIEIPCIDVELPIYHGTDESALQKGAGHMEGSALPTGDIGNNTAITGHTGLPAAHLFTDLDEMVIGDRFYVKVLNQTFAYEVADLFVVLPSDAEKLKPDPTRDLVTLVTCTPYGVNSHRLLVQGERVEYIQEKQEEVVLSKPVIEEETSNALKGLPTLITIAMVLACIFVIVMTICIVQLIHMIKEKKTEASKTKNSEDNEEA